MRNTLWMLGGQILRVAIQILYFLIIAKRLNPEGFGAFAGTVALALLVSPFVGFCSGNVLIQHVARDRSAFGRYWGSGLILIALSAPAMLALVIGLGPFLLGGGISLTMIALIGLAELLFFRVADLGAQAFQSHDILPRTAQLQVLGNLIRLIAATFLLLLPVGSASLAEIWSGLYLASSVVCAAVTVFLVNRDLGGPRLQLAWREVGLGIYFSLGLAAANTSAQIDKTMLVRFADLGSAGIYAAAYRLIDVAFTPIAALLSSTYASFFMEGQHGLRSSTRFALRLLPLGVAYGLGIAVLLYLAAPLVPVVLGDAYSGAAGAIRWLCLLPLLRCLHVFSGDALAGAERQYIRAWTQILMMAVNIGLNLWLIPRYSWHGAAWAALATDCLLALFGWTQIWRHCHMERRGAQADAAAAGGLSR